MSLQGKDEETIRIKRMTRRTYFSQGALITQGRPFLFVVDPAEKLRIQVGKPVLLRFSLHEFIPR